MFLRKVTERRLAPSDTKHRCEVLRRNEVSPTSLVPLRPSHVNLLTLRDACLYENNHLIGVKDTK